MRTRGLVKSVLIKLHFTGLKNVANVEVPKNKNGHLRLALKGNQLHLTSMLKLPTLHQK